jgi:hypothetical protein
MLATITTTEEALRTGLDTRDLHEGIHLDVKSAICTCAEVVTSYSKTVIEGFGPTDGLFLSYARITGNAETVQYWGSRHIAGWYLENSINLGTAFGNSFGAFIGAAPSERGLRRLDSLSLAGGTDGQRVRKALYSAHFVNRAGLCIYDALRFFDPQFRPISRVQGIQ